MTEPLKKALIPLLLFMGALWVIEGANLLLGHSLNSWGLLPRTLKGLAGIFTSPFLHGGPLHLLANTFPLAVLGTLVALRGRALFFEVTLFIILGGGTMLWTLGRSAYHVGASGLVFGFFGFLVASGWFRRDLSSLLIAFITLFLYSGMLWGLLPLFKGVSWEGHLFGLVAGIFAARLDKEENPS